MQKCVLGRGIPAPYTGSRAPPTTTVTRRGGEKRSRFANAAVREVLVIHMDAWNCCRRGFVLALQI
jgi:hypothetical protein